MLWSSANTQHKESKEKRARATTHVLLCAKPWPSHQASHGDVTSINPRQPQWHSGKWAVPSRERGFFSPNNPSVPAQRFARGKDSPEKIAQPKEGSSNTLAGLTHNIIAPHRQRLLLF